MTVFTGSIAQLLSGANIDGATILAWAQALQALSDPWTSYNPTTSGITLGTGGTITTSYNQIGKLVNYRGRLTLGTSGSFTGTATISLPVTAADFNWVGAAWAYDNSTAVNRQAAVATPSGASNTVFYGANPSGIINSTTPFNWAVSDVLVWSITYEAA